MSPWHAEDHYLVEAYERERDCKAGDSETATSESRHLEIGKAHKFLNKYGINILV